ncbi:MAG: hypothetical protein QG670_382 [Thermoproteota archaeon]|nr:hypothetical protein [Thermoproteota archaeon]
MTFEVFESASGRAFTAKVGSRVYLVKVSAEKDTNVGDIYLALEKVGIKASVQFLEYRKTLYVKPAF